MGWVSPSVFFFSSSLIFFVLIADIEGFVGVFYFFGCKAWEKMAKERLWYLEGVKYVDRITININLIKHHHYCPHHNYQHNKCHYYFWEWYSD